MLIYKTSKGAPRAYSQVRLFTKHQKQNVINLTFIIIHDYFFLNASSDFVLKAALRIYCIKPLPSNS